MIKNDKTYLEHIVESIDFIHRRRFSDVDSFLSDEVFYQAALRQLQNLSESTSRLTDKIKSRNKSIAWKEIKAFRNALVHDYLGDIIPEVILEVINAELPILKEMAENELKLLEEK